MRDVAQRQLGMFSIDFHQNIETDLGCLVLLFWVLRKGPDELHLQLPLIDQECDVLEGEISNKCLSWHTSLIAQEVWIPSTVPK